MTPQWFPSFFRFPVVIPRPLAPRPDWREGLSRLTTRRVASPAVAPRARALLGCESSVSRGRLLVARYSPGKPGVGRKSLWSIWLLAHRVARAMREPRSPGVWPRDSHIVRARTSAARRARRPYRGIGRISAYRSPRGGHARRRTVDRTRRTCSRCDGAGDVPHMLYSSSSSASSSAACSLHVRDAARIARRSRVSSSSGSACTGLKLMCVRSLRNSWAGLELIAAPHTVGLAGEAVRGGEGGDSGDRKCDTH